jgi:hypothetical protein
MWASVGVVNSGGSSVAQVEELEDWGEVGGNVVKSEKETPVQSIYHLYDIVQEKVRCST